VKFGGIILVTTSSESISKVMIPNFVNPNSLTFVINPLNSEPLSGKTLFHRLIILVISTEL
jgi:hypothetical protein